ncbi:DUF2089 domain-containing protein [Tessaracoccus flavus]|uniref:Uncharacterized protein n=1 Tax=Tessaracoccus flavus TaxID=1610493 RepID=A0A1Q2CGE7_9ACTN|nr:DUF2089 domain-containing protein [Tessaracoccus flavus]AQP45186.1 hypothetical protein RPIT_10575 [Tessaracoccus flavus]SDY53796.1 hypothetical protein SAMN05428934_102190 [Tessaracoccus flavus]
MVKHLYHAPADCPVCGDELITTRKGCLKCGSELAGEFASCEFCALSEPDLQILRVFLGSRGNLREVEKHLQVSYPTARARLDAVLVKLGFDQAGERNAPEHAEQDGRDSDSATPESQILERVARGELSPEVAAQLLGD